MKKRIVSVDLFRGFLILAMVIFHILTNLSHIGENFDHHLFYWVPAGFSMFLGVIIAKFLSQKHKKLLKIALKLIGIFLILNILNFKNNAITFQDLLIGNQEKLSFEILFPMGLFTLVSMFLYKLKNKKIISTILLTIIGSTLILNIYEIYSYNLSMFLFAASGYFLEELIDFNQIAEKLKDKKSKDFIFKVFLALFLAQLFFIQSFIFAEIIVLLEIIILFLLTNLIFPSKPLTFLGKHSLLIYISHIFIIKAITLYLT